MKNILIGIFTVILGMCYGQSADWVDQMHDPNVNFYTVQQSFENYWKEREVEKGKGWKQFKRWEAFMAPRVYPSGERPNPSILAAEYFKMEAESTAPTGQWKPLGPYDGPSLGGVGRVNCIAFHPTNSQIMWVGTPAGGLWKSTDGGQTWMTNTDQLTNLGVSAIAVHPTNDSILYIATGDNDAGDTYSYGILKSSDGGLTYAPTGLSFPVQNQVRVGDIKINPTNPNVLVVSSRAGIYRSTNAGVSWLQVQSGSFDRMEQKPGSDSVLYASTISGSSCRIYRSTNAGKTWAQLSIPAMPINNARRIELAVTPDDPNYVYAVVGASNNGFEGIYRSTNGGDTWTQRANSPNLLGWSTTGSDQGGQAWYDLALAVNPNDKNELFVGGVNIWSSSNGGSSWSLAAHWFGGGNRPFVHADIHWLAFSPNTTGVFACTDGGLYHDIIGQKNWDALNDGMNITQYYRLGAAASDTTRILAGAQDNGTHRYVSGNWAHVNGGDGMECAINPENSNVMYASSQYGNIRKSTNGGSSFNANFNLPPTGNGNWVTPYQLDPQHPDTMYAGYDRMWRSYNGGASFTAVSPSNLTGGNNIDQMAIAPRHENVLYISEGDRLWRSNDYGANWSQRNPPGNNAITYITVSYEDPDHVIISRSGYSSNQKVYESRDGGSSWTNLSAGLPNVPANAVTIENGNEQGIYVGTDLGVFYRDSETDGWQDFNQDLPNVIMNELEINYINNKIRIATYGRGLWESPLYRDLVKPKARMEIAQNICLGDTATLLDASFYDPNNFEWTITPTTFSFVNGTSATSQNPEIYFSQKGIYNVKLNVSNENGEDSLLVTSALAVGGYPLTYQNDFEEIPPFQKFETPEIADGKWQRTETSGNGSFVAPLRNATVGAEFELISPPISFENHDSVWMSFRHAYGGRGANTSDSLKIYAATGCSSNWTLVAALGEDGSQNFITASPTNSVFKPSNGQWCGNSLAACNTLNLSSLAGMEGVRLRFVAVSNGGNHLYIDDILIEGNPTAAPQADFSSPSTVCALSLVSFTDQSFGSPNSYLWTFSGPATFTDTNRHPTVTFAQAGFYDVELKVSNGIGADSLLKTAQIAIDPADSVQATLLYSSQMICFGDTFAASVSGSGFGANPVFHWYVNGNLEASGADPSFSYLNLKQGDFVYAIVESSLACAFPENASTDTVAAPVLPNVVPQLQSKPLWCSTEAADTLKAAPGGGTFSGPGVVNNVFDPKVVGQGNNIYTYTVQDSNGCTYSAQFSLAVQAPISFSFDPNPQVCENETNISLTVATPGGGQYGGPGIFGNRFFPDSLGTGTYTLTYLYNTAACGTIIDSFQIDVLPRPAQPAVTQSAGSLTSSPAAAYQWFDAGGAIGGVTSQTFVPSQSGQFSVRIADGNGCQNFSDTVSFNIGLDELPLGISLEIFPNPADESVTLKMVGGRIPKVEMQFYDVLGKVLENRVLDWNNDQSIILDVSQLPAGMYQISLNGEGVAVHRKILVK